MKISEYSKISNNYIKFRRTVYVIIGILETIFFLRFIFKIIGANTQFTTVAIIYKITGAIMTPFGSIFRITVNKGLEMKSVMEPATIIAMTVLGIFAYGLLKKIKSYDITKKNKYN